MRLLTALSLAVPLLWTASASADNGLSPKEVVLGMIGAINHRDFDALDTFVAADVHRYSGATPGVEVENLDQFKAFLKEDLAGVPDAQQEVNLIFAADDMVAIQATYRGTQTGPMGPFPPSGRSLELPLLGILRVEDGKIAEMWVEWDNLNALVQLGHISPPAAPGDTPAKQ